MDNIRTGKMDTEKNTTSDLDIIPLNLLGLPVLVIAKILDCFTLFTLKKLRLVNKKMKELVETPRNLEKFRIVAKINVQEELINSSCTVKWNNFYFPENFELSAFIIQKYGSYIHNLQIDEPLNYNELKMVINALRPLDPQQSFPVIKTLQFNKCNGVRKKFSKYLDNYDDMSNWDEILKNLKSLRINCDYWFLDMDLLRFFFKFVINCPNLTFLQIPLRSYLDNMDPHYSHLLKYLEIIKYSCKRYNNLIIDFNYEYIASMSPDDSKDFFNLLKFTSEIGIKFLNFPSGLLHKYNMDLTSNMRNIYDKSIISVKSFDVTNLENAYIPSNSIVKVMYNFLNNVILPIGSIHSIQALIFCGEQYFNIPFNHLFTIVRSTVKELNLSFQCVCHHAEGIVHQENRLPLNFADFYPNLEILTLGSTYHLLESPNFYNNLFSNGLENLNSLNIYCICNNNVTNALNDAVILGEDINNPLIFQLPNLTHLELKCTRLTNKSFLNAFRFMHLKTFHFSNCSRMNDYDESVTFQNGISTLATIEGGFRDTIENFKIILPSDSTMLEMEEFLNNFQNLRKAIINKKN